MARYPRAFGSYSQHEGQMWKEGGERGQRRRGAVRRFVLTNLLVLLTMVGVALGFLLGLLVRKLHPSLDAIIWIGLPGEVYMRMLKMMILPLIVCSVITGTASLDPKCNGRISAVALTYIIVTNSLPCFVGIAMAFSIRPGEGVEMTAPSTVLPKQVMETSDIFADLIRNLFPDNVVAACFQQAQTQYHSLEQQTTVNSTGHEVNQTVILKVKTVGTVDSTNVLGLVLCCMVFGIASTSVGSAGQPFLAFFKSANEIIMVILRWFVWVTPVGVASLISVALLRAEELSQSVRSLGLFCLTVLGGLLLYQLLVLPLLFFLLTRTNPYTFLLKLGRPWVVSFATTSSAIAIPEMLQVLEQGQQVDKRISRFVVPFASTINRDGTTLFITVSCIFVGQLSNTHLDPAMIVMIWVLTTAISLAIPSVPSASMVAILMNLTALGIPADSLGLLFATEWILDRLRSGSNVLSHAYCARTTHILCHKSLPPLESDVIASDETEIDVSPNPVPLNGPKNADLTEKMLTDV